MIVPVIFLDVYYARLYSTRVCAMLSIYKCLKVKQVGKVGKIPATLKPTLKESNGRTFRTK
jgi:hypothetical protein